MRHFLWYSANKLSNFPWNPAKEKNTSLGITVSFSIFSLFIKSEFLFFIFIKWTMKFHFHISYYEKMKNETVLPIYFLNCRISKEILTILVCIMLQKKGMYFPTYQSDISFFIFHLIKRRMKINFAFNENGTWKKRWELFWLNK